MGKKYPKNSWFFRSKIDTDRVLSADLTLKRYKRGTCHKKTCFFIDPLPCGTVCIDVYVRECVLLLSVFVKRAGLSKNSSETTEESGICCGMDMEDQHSIRWALFQILKKEACFSNVRQRYEQKFLSAFEHFQRHNSLTVSLPSSYHSVPRVFRARGTSNRR